METYNFPNKNDTANEAVSDMAGQIGASAVHVVDSAKNAGKHVASVAKEEMDGFRSDLDDLVSRVSTMSSIELVAAKENLLTKIETAKTSAKGVTKEIRQQLHHGVDVTTDYVKERPMKSMALATGVGILLGMLISRR